MHVALAQTCPVSADVGAAKDLGAVNTNLAQIRKYTQEAAASQAEVVVFPEYCAQGIVNEGRQYLTEVSDLILDYIISLAKEFHICIVGTIVHGEKRDGRPTDLDSEAWKTYFVSLQEEIEPALRNTAFFVNSEGKLLGQYVKRNLWHPEREYLSPGEEDHQTFDTPFGRVGMLICWDMSHPHAAQSLAEQGADIIFAPTYWMTTDSNPLLQNHPHRADYELQVVSSLCMVRAFETETVWIMCNAGGGQDFMGGSGVWVPLRGTVEQMGQGAGMVVVQIDTEVLKDARETYKIREDASKRTGL